MENSDKGKSPLSIIFLILAFISFITYTVIEILKFESFLNFLPQLLGMGVIFLFLVCFIIISIKSKNKQTVTIIIGSILITIYSVFNILLSLNIINLPSDEFIPNFYDKSLTEVNKWKEKNNIKTIEQYEYSDTISKYSVISQDKTYPLLTKDITELTLTISLGPDPNKEIIVPSFIGLKYEEVLKYIRENHLSNVEFEFTASSNQIDTVIEQNGSGTMKRSDKITITIANNADFGEIEIPDFTNKDLLEVTTWLKKHGFKYEIEYDYNDEIEKDYIISQNTKKEVKNPETDIIKLNVSKGKMMIAPDILEMPVDDINEWILENNLKVTYKEMYSDDIKLGDIISSSVTKGDEVDSGTNVEITISKGSLEMIKLTNINEFINWATNNNVDYEINYEYSESVKKDDILRCSHSEGEKIKLNDTVVITVSKGKSINLPNFVGMNKNDIQKKCQSINLNCSFKTGGYTENTKANIAISQSKKSGTTVSEGTSLTITLSKGIIEKVNVPSFIGKTKSQVETECKNIGINCKFTYANGYDNNPKDTVTKQDSTGKINKGSNINITLSNGPANTYNIIIDANQLSSGNPEATKNTLEKKLKNACPGVNFIFKFEKANSGIGYLAQKSDVKVGSNKLTQGKTYTIIINSN